jgi:predicted nucleotidyltransferase
MTEVLAAPDTAAPPIVLKHLPAEIARTVLRFRDELLARFPGQIRRLILFGSQARGGATADSDVDVLVVTPWQGEALRHDYAPDRHIGQEEAAVIVADAESFIALARQLSERRA